MPSTLPADPIYPPFKPAFPWIGGDLQTLRNFILRPRTPIRAASTQQLSFPMPDGSGDALSGTLDRPVSATMDAPLLVMIHGLTGCEDGFHIRGTARHFLDAGWPVLRLNLRGAGSSAGKTTGQYHAGRSEDLRAVIDQLLERGVAERIALYGVSLGANMMLKYLAETGRHPSIAGAVSISAPIDLAQTSERFLQPRNRLYQRFLLKQMKAEALRCLGLSAAEIRAIETARTTFEFDDRFIAPRNGFLSARDYFTRSSSAPLLKSILTPTLVIHALNDPWIPGRMYLQADLGSNPRLAPLLPLDGGHVGFHDAEGVWSDRVASTYLRKMAGVE